MCNRVNVIFNDGETCVLIGVISIIFYGDSVYFITDDSESYDFVSSTVKSFQFFSKSSEGML